MVMASCPVGEDGRIEDLSTTCAFPGIEGSHVIIKLLVEHTAFAFRTFHDLSPLMAYIIKQTSDIFS
jgi:hypothetical protein